MVLNPQLGKHNGCRHVCSIIASHISTLVASCVFKLQTEMEEMPSWKRGALAKT